MRTIAILFLFAIPLAVDANPDKPAPKSEQKKAAPVIVTGLTNWGTVQRSGNVLKIEGHPVWDAIGEIRPDGKTVYLLWTLKATNEPCPSVYHVHADGSLDGVWGYGGMCHVDDKGDLVGVTHSDRIHSVEPPVPGF